MSAQVTFQNFASGSVFEPLNGFFLDLPDPLPGKVKFFTDLLQGMGMFPVESEIESDNTRLPVSEGAQSPFNLFSQ